MGLNEGKASFGSSSLILFSMPLSSFKTASIPCSLTAVAEPRNLLNSRPVAGSKRTPEVFWRLETLRK